MKILFFLSLVVSLNSYGQTCFKETGAKTSKEDPFYKARVANIGSYRGECYNNAFRRNAPRFDPSNQADLKTISSLYGLKMKKGKVYLGNFLHRGEYLLAEYTPGSIERVVMMFEKFIEPMNNIVLTGHTHLRFILKQPIKLYHPTKGLVGEVKDFNYAMFAVRPMSIKGLTFSPFGDGIKKNYAITHNFMSTIDMATEYKSYAAEGATEVSQYELESFALDFEKTLQALINFSDVAYHQAELAPYHTITNNCVSNMFVGIESGDKGVRLAPHDYEGRVIIKNNRRFYTPRNPQKGMVKNPLWILRTLENRGMIITRKANQRESFNTELCRVLDQAGLAVPKGCSL